jgi:phage terminase small subunit
VVAPADTPLAFLLDVMNNVDLDVRLRVRAAIAAVPFVHTRGVELGKKERQALAGKKASTGRFAPAAPPLKLITRNPG